MSTQLQCLTSSPLLQAVPDGPHWYALYTYPRHEKAVADHLTRQSVEAFFPTVTTKSQWKDRRVTLQSPLFPSYLFTRIRLSDRRNIVSIPSVIRMVSFNGVPAVLSDHEVESVRRCIASGVSLEPHPYLVAGERVRVRAGSFEGLEGFVTFRKNGGKLVISIGMIQQSVAIEIDMDKLERIQS
jgi:transcription antitermination factor NusG